MEIDLDIEQVSHIATALWLAQDAFPEHAEWSADFADLLEQCHCAGATLHINKK